MYPILFRLGSLTIYGYGFFLVIAIFAGGILAFRKARKEGLRIPLEQIADLFFYIVLSAIARLNVSLHPTQLYDAANGLALFFLNWMEKRKAFDGQIFWLFLFLYSVTRFFIEMLRGDPRGFIFPYLLSTSQGIGVFLAIASLFMLFYLKKEQRRMEDGSVGNS